MHGKGANEAKFTIKMNVFQLLFGFSYHFEWEQMIKMQYSIRIKQKAIEREKKTESSWDEIRANSEINVSMIFTKYLILVCFHCIHPMCKYLISYYVKTIQKSVDFCPEAENFCFRGKSESRN